MKSYFVIFEFEKFTVIEDERTWTDLEKSGKIVKYQFGDFDTATLYSLKENGSITSEELQAKLKEL